jgi:hypothetical protein
MKFFFPSLLIGIITALFIFQPSGGLEINSSYGKDLKEMKELKDVVHSSHKISSSDVSYSIDNKIYSIDKSGKVINIITKPGYYGKLSGNGGFFVSYGKVGKKIEYYSVKNERFWKIKSREYPYLSYNSKMIFLMNGDHTRVRIINENGAEIGVKFIEGRFCTSIVFSQNSDYGAIGFADGTFYFINPKGSLIYRGRTALGTMVKGLSISSNGLYGSIHYGSTSSDAITLVNIKEKKTKTFTLKSQHIMKSTLLTTNKGEVLFGDFNSILFIKKNGEIKFSLTIPKRKAGFISISQHGNLFSSGFTTEKGVAMHVFFDSEVSMIMSKMFNRESFLGSKGNRSVIHLRGSHSLYGYNLQY